MLQINGKTFMNLQEAVQWLLDNNAIPFQSSANYIANTEIGMGTIVNPSPAKVRIGSLIFFADSKVSTVIGLTENGFIVSDQYNDLVDDVVYVSNVALNASGHLIVTLSNGDSIDAGLIKQVNNFSIDASQHLIANYNDGTSTDLGAIFSGNITISGNLTVTGGISGNAITGDSIIENMSGYTYNSHSNPASEIVKEDIYAGVVKNGNKITFCYYGKIKRIDTVSAGGGMIGLCYFYIPSAIGSKLYPSQDDRLEMKEVYCAIDYDSGISIPGTVAKSSNTLLAFRLYKGNDLTLNQDYLLRFEVTFLLSDNLAS